MFVVFLCRAVLSFFFILNLNGVVRRCLACVAISGFAPSLMHESQSSVIKSSASVEVSLCLPPIPPLLSGTWKHASDQSTKVE